VGAVLIVLAGIQYVVSRGTSRFLLVLIIVVLASSVRSYFRYRKLQAQSGMEFIGSRELE